MPTMKIIRRRIASVNSTKQIMKAMNLAASSKVQKARVQLDLIRPMFDDVEMIIDSIRTCESTEENIFVQKRKVKRVAYLVIMADRGLCGAYNINVGKAALAHMNEHADGKETIIAIGSRSWDFFRRRGKNITHKYQGVTESVTPDFAQEIGQKLLNMYKSGEADELYIVYTSFISILSYMPKVIKVLPLSAETRKLEGESFDVMSYDPDVNTFLDHTVPLYINTLIYSTMMESNVCEQAARMTSMDAAARNADEIIEDLTLDYNRRRQGAITQEISEIVSGANAI